MNWVKTMVAPFPMTILSTFLLPTHLIAVKYVSKKSGRPAEVLLPVLSVTRAQWGEPAASACSRSTRRSDGWWISAPVPLGTPCSSSSAPPLSVNNRHLSQVTTQLGGGGASTTTESWSQSIFAALSQIWYFPELRFPNFSRNIFGMKNKENEISPCELYM